MDAAFIMLIYHHLLPVMRVICLNHPIAAITTALRHWQMESSYKNDKLVLGITSNKQKDFTVEKILRPGQAALYPRDRRSII